MVDRDKKRLDVLYEVSEKIINTLDLRTVLNRIVKLAVETLQADTGSLMLLDEKKQRLNIKASLGLKKEIAQRASVKVGERIAGWVAQHQKPLLLLDGLKGYPDFSHLSGKTNIDSAISIPVRLKEQLIGVLNINRMKHSQRPIFSNKDMELVMTLANQTAVAIHNARLHHELKEQNRRLKHATQAKTRLISHITHELRSPLTAIKGYTANMLDGLQGNLTPSQTERLQKIEKLCHQQNNLVNQLLEISRIASGHLEMRREKVDLRQVVNNALLNLGTIPEDKHLNITVKLPENLPLVWGNSDKLERLFINLLSNAVKYTPAKGKISITGAIQDKNLQTSVSDTGIGISSKDLNRIFDEFYRVENDINSKLLGTGLGLTLVKHIIEAHGGKILARSTPGKGTTFSFNLPIDPRLQKKAE